MKVVWALGFGPAPASFFLNELSASLNLKSLFSLRLSLSLSQPLSFSSFLFFSFPLTKQLPTSLMPISSLSLLYSSFSFSKDAPIFISPTKDAVYVAAVPLRAAPGPAQLLLSTAYNFDFGHRHLRHYVVLIKSPHHDQVLLFDFQPKDPENIFAALAVISQKKLPGVILKREITRIPRTRCWFVGFSKGNSLEIANRFNQNWSTDLVVGTNDCRHYANGLVECLTGEENVLESLKN